MKLAMFTTPTDYQDQTKHEIKKVNPRCKHKTFNFLDCTVGNLHHSFQSKRISIECKIELLRYCIHDHAHFACIHQKEAQLVLH